LANTTPKNDIELALVVKTSTLVFSPFGAEPGDLFKLAWNQASSMNTQLFR
jgi:hypothetical protein